MDIGDLLELQRALQAHGIVQIAADEEDGVVVEILGGEVLDIGGLGQDGLHLLRNGIGLLQNGLIFLRLHGAQHVRQIQPQQIQHRQLGGIGLGGGHGDLRASPGVEHIVGLTGDGGAHHVDDGQSAAAQTLGLPHGGHGVQGLAGLADDDDQGLGVHQRVAVAELRGQKHLHRPAQQPLQVVLAHHAHMVGRAAGDDVDLVEVPDLPGGELQIIQRHVAVPDAGEHGLAEGLRLLHDLLEHEVGVAALFRRGHVPGHMLMLLLHRLEHIVVDLDAVGGDDGDLTVVHIGDVPGVLDHGRHIRGQEVEPVAIAQDQRAVLSGGDEGTGIVAADDAKAVGALDTVDHTGDRVEHIMALVVVVLQQLGHNLRVGIR